MIPKSEEKLIITMLSFNIYKTFVIYFLLSLLKLMLTCQGAPIFLYHDCTNTTSFSTNGTFQRNLNLLLSSLSSNSTRDNRFYNLTVGSDPENIVYGLFVCRGDATDDLCRDCVETATKDIVQRCPTDKAAIITYEECMLRYSNQNFFGKLETKPALQLVNNLNISQQEQFLEALERTTRNVTAKIANDRSGRRFATVESPFTSKQKIYALGQCTQDLSVADCNKCLEAAFAYFIPSCCGVREGGRVIFPSCNFRYELYPFYSVAESPTSTAGPGSKGKRNLSPGKIIGIAAATVSVAFVVLLIAAFCCLTRKRKKNQHAMEEQTAANDMTTVESLQFDLGTIAAATNKFSHVNKLGEGGFGQVYKGVLRNGQEIAVKRLSGRSGQGDKQFKNEVAVVAKLQHRNLVRLLGFCLERGERLLIFEFVPNKSLDCFLFGTQNRGELDWPTRYNIIKGIARGMLYLHEDSQPRIIHRDLKVSNVLLDREMNPKISDFGMARIFGVDEQQGSTSRIVGTYGYMSPEYAMHGQFSVKSDVYSFGVSVLEIISGKKNNSFHQVDGFEDLLSYSWKLWSDGAALELLDPLLRESYSEDEVIRCMQIGLLCVQEDPAKRPTMTTIVLMLNSQILTLEAPQRPASFFRYKDETSIPTNEGQSPLLSMPSSINETSISETYPR
ncbi:Cysteine-rich protein, putative isoform 1 [Theobroma cacao]|uniref:Cysteine-rich protein, putative isoform 1 n=1 Tax=Theobroma cacao TaxID=3641 RepID=A0A061GFA1_THECC|nr:Cysteine-rich protein, putative isoform 1 [Theobroma cacao]EOY28566.1 Cysteine-rich protein, putative isoform 1 [Theobroma cacao]